MEDDDELPPLESDDEDDKAVPTKTVKGGIADIWTDSEEEDEELPPLESTMRMTSSSSLARTRMSRTTRMPMMMRSRSPLAT